MEVTIEAGSEGAELALMPRRARVESVRAQAVTRTSGRRERLSVIVGNAMTRLVGDDIGRRLLPVSDCSSRFAESRLNRSRDRSPARVER